MPKRYGKCTNFGGCPIADSHKVIEVNEGEDFNCPKPPEGCGLPLYASQPPLPPVSSFWNKRIIAIILGITVLAVIGWLIFSPAPPSYPATKTQSQVIPIADTASKPPPIPKNNTDNIKQILLDIANPQLSFEERKTKANTALSKIFTSDFNVVMHEDTATALQTIWERGDGKNYLRDRLTTDDSILDFIVLNADRSSIDNKISHLELVEIHKK